MFFCNILLRYAHPPVHKGQTSGSGAGDVGPAHDFVFQGAISSVFQSHLKRYVELEEQELRGSMARALKVLVSCFDFVRSNPPESPRPPVVIKVTCVCRTRTGKGWTWAMALRCFLLHKQFLVLLRKCERPERASLSHWVYVTFVCMWLQASSMTLNASAGSGSGSSSSSTFTSSIAAVFAKHLTSYAEALKQVRCPAGDA